MRPASFTSSNISPTNPFPRTSHLPQAPKQDMLVEENISHAHQPAISSQALAAQRERALKSMQPLPVTPNAAEVNSPEVSSPQDKAKLAYAKEFIKDVLADLYKRTKSEPGSDIPQDGSWQSHLFKFHHPLITVALNSLFGGVGGHIQAYDEFRKYNDFSGWGDHQPQFDTNAAKLRAIGIGAASAVLMELGWSVKNVIAERRKNLQPSVESQQEAGQLSWDAFGPPSPRSDSFRPAEFREDLVLEDLSKKANLTSDMLAQTASGPSNLSPDIETYLASWAQTSGHHPKP